MADTRRAYRRARLTDTALGCLEGLKLKFAEASCGPETPKPAVAKRMQTWDDSTPTPIMGNPVLPQAATAGSPE